MWRIGNVSRPCIKEKITVSLLHNWVITVTWQDLCIAPRSGMTLIRIAGLHLDTRNRNAGGQLTRVAT